MRIFWNRKQDIDQQFADNVPLMARGTTQCADRGQGENISTDHGREKGRLHQVLDTAPPYVHDYPLLLD